MKAGAYEYDEEGEKAGMGNKKANGLPIWGNEKTMNLNPLILTNIQSSQYFKVNLYQLKTYHEVIDEIYYNVSHLEPWEKGSRKTSGQTGMCGGVRGVGAGGIVSTAFCILYKLYTLRLTRKQVVGLLNHTDSPYIRGLGFMYIRYTQPPADLWDWFEGYLDDDEEIDVRAGGGQTTTIGQMVRSMLSKLDWYSTLFPRIPVPIQKDLEKKLAERNAARPPAQSITQAASVPNATSGKKDWYGWRQESDASRDNIKDTARDPGRGYDGRERVEKEQDRDRVRDYDRGRDNERDRGRDYERDRGREYDRDRGRDREYDRDRGRDRGRDRERERDDRDKWRDAERSRGAEKNGDHRDKHRDRHRRDKERSRDHSRDRSRRSRSRSHDKKHRHRNDHRDFADLLEREKHRIKKEKREGSRDRHHRSRSKERERDRERRHRH